MQRGLHTLSTPPYQYDSVRTAEALHPSPGPHPEFLSDEHESRATFAGPYTAMNHPGFATPSHSQYGNVGRGEPSFHVASFREDAPYAYQDNNQIVSLAHYGVGATQNIYAPSIAPGLLQPEYYAPPDHQPQEIPNDVAIGPAPHLPNVAVPFQGIPSPVPPGMSVEEEPERLANRYYHNPNSRVYKVRVRRSRRPGEVKVMILLKLAKMK